MTRKTISTATLLSGAMLSTSWASISFTNDLTSSTAVATHFNENKSTANNSSWTYVTTGATDQNGDANTVLTGGAILDSVTTDDDTARSYLATKLSNYGSTSWTARVAIEAPSSTKPYIFFGLGTGTPLVSYYNEPRDGENVYMSFQSGNSNSKIRVFNDNGTNLHDTGSWQGDPGYDLYMHYNHVDETITFEVDNWSGGRNSGINVTTGAIDVSSSLTGAGDTRIFFGSNAKATWADFSVTVVPEPSSTALLGLGALALAFRRRK